MSDSNKIAIITGASQGIGKAIFDFFVEQGITAIGVSRNIELTGYTHHCDVCNESEVKALFSDVINTFGRVDILVNNAGISTQTDIVDTSLEEWERVLKTNLTGTFLCTKYALKYMKTQKYGKIINISSIAGRFRSAMASVAYTCSKYGVIGMTRQLALHYAKYNININCVAPSQTRTKMLIENVDEEQLKKFISTIPAGRLAEPDDIAQAVWFLASDSASYLNGAVLDINGGQF